MREYCEEDYWRFKKCLSDIRIKFHFLNIKNCYTDLQI